MPYIYKIWNDINNKMYIGKTTSSIQKRWKEHCRDSKNFNKQQRPLYQAIKKYGINHFHIEMIEECSIESLSEREKYWIEYFGSFKYGYNATKGGDGAVYLDYELIYKTYCITKSLKQTALLCGCHEDSVKKIIQIYGISEQEITTNRILNNSKTVAMLDKNTKEILKIFSSTHEAGKFLNKTHQHIQEVCQGKRKTAYGYCWKYI